MYDEEKIKLRVVNGDGAKWTKGIRSKNSIYQKDAFHIRQEIIRNVPKEYRKRIEELVKNRRYDEMQSTIEKLKYEVGGEERAVKKLETLKSYLSADLDRYQDILKDRNIEFPKAPEGIEYRNLGTQESQIFSKLKVRFCSGRKAFSIHGANALAKVCVSIGENFRISEIENSIEIDTSVEDWINEIENKIVKKRRNVEISRNNENISDCKTSSLQDTPKFLRDIAKEIDFLSMKCSF